jgi:hypothetical protein
MGEWAIRRYGDTAIRRYGEWIVFSGEAAAQESLG